jgi:signal peptidase I
MASLWQNPKLRFVFNCLSFVIIPYASSPLLSQAIGPIASSSSSDIRYYIMPDAISMMPTILPRDRVVVDEAYYRNHSLGRGDLVLVRVPQNLDVLQVKRVVGIPGDVIAIKNGTLYQNGQKESLTGYSITPHVTSGQSHGSPQLFNRPQVHLSKGQIYVLGDHRPAALDSRTWGPIYDAHVVGKPMYIYWSTDLLRIGKALN